MTPTERRDTWLLFAIAFFVLAAGYGLREPWPADEPRFVLVAKQMAESGNFLFPHRGAELYPDKPPFYFWLLALAHAVIGSWRWSFLLPSLLAGLGTLWLTFDLGRRLWTPRAGWWAATAVLVSFQFVYQVKRAQIDPTLLFLTTLSFYGLCRHLLLGPDWRWYWGACFAAGLGVITKGVGFLPLLALLPVMAMARWNWNGLAPPGRGNVLRWSLGGLAFLAAIAMWLGPVLAVGLGSGDPEHQQYLQNILFKQTAQRYADPWHHREPAWYFLQVVLLFWLPFALALPWLIKPWVRGWRTRDAKVWLPLSWFLLVFLFFSASAGKRDMYLLPALPALALAAAPFLEAIAARVAFRRVVLVFVLLLSCVLLAGGAAALLSDPRFASTLQTQRGLGDEVRWLWLMLASVGAAGLVAAAIGRVRGALASCALLLVLLWSGYGFVVHPLLDDENSSRGVMRQARVLAGDATTIGLVHWREQNLLQAVGPVAEFGFRQPPARQLQRGIAWLHEHPEQRRLLVQRSAALDCIDFSGVGPARRVGHANRREWWLLDETALAGCTTPGPAR